ncbi:28627_t:CDS:1, partial [Racocetra persica]
QSAALQKKFTNTKHACAKHLLNCEYCTERYTKEQIQEIVQKANENGSNKRLRAGSFNSNFETEDNESRSTSSNEIFITHQNYELLDNYCIMS